MASLKYVGIKLQNAITSFSSFRITPIGALDKYSSLNWPTEKCISWRLSSHKSLTCWSSFINSVENGGSIISNEILSSSNLFKVALNPRRFLPEVENCVKSIIASSPNLKNWLPKLWYKGMCWSVTW